MIDAHDMSRPELEALLRWYRAAGVAAAVAETPADQFAAARAAPAPARTVGAASSPPATATTEGDAAEARALAAGAATLDELRAVLERYDGCPLKARATRLVFADGNPDAGVMLVGEAPGRDEDLQGRPFVGRSGQLLDRMLGAIGLSREHVYIANTVPWRPPGNRDPAPAEIAVCLPFLHRQIELVAPRLLVTLGAAATRTVLGAEGPISRLRGQWRPLAIGATEMEAMATWHPAYLLRQPAQKRQAWADLLSLKARLEGLAR